MTTSVNVNQPIDITAPGFTRAKGPCLQSWPRCMVWQEKEYSFAELSMQYLVQKGQELIRLFDVSDGQTIFRLRQNPEGSGRLLALRRQFRRGDGANMDNDFICGRQRSCCRLPRGGHPPRLSQPRRRHF